MNSDEFRTGVPMLRANPPADEQAVQRLAESIRHPIPEQLERFLRLHDGCWFESNGYRDLDVSVHVVDSADKIREYYDTVYVDRLPRSLLPFATTEWGDPVCISLDDGTIWTADHEQEVDDPEAAAVDFVAESLADLLAGLEPSGPASIPTDPQQRYLWFLRTLARTGLIWLLSGDDDVAALDDDDGVLIPIWPDEPSAAEAARDRWRDCKPEVVDLETWTTRWSPAYAADGVRLLVFPEREEGGAVVAPDELLADLARLRRTD
jgi:Protein of unknown function (DUF2750)/SMI1-KNR4 cell-wall